jgi:hypothetical protein
MPNEITQHNSNNQRQQKPPVLANQRAGSNHNNKNQRTQSFNVPQYLFLPAILFHTQFWQKETSRIALPLFAKPYLEILRNPI